jgi:hypothetical protein
MYFVPETRAYVLENVNDTIAAVVDNVVADIGSDVANSVPGTLLEPYVPVWE